MRFPVSCPIHIVMIGCGGTGGHIAPHLYRLLYSVFRPSTVILCDGRRSFCSSSALSI